MNAAYTAWTDEMIALTEQQLETIQALCRAHHVVRLEIFGSAARDDFDPNTSDVDVLVEYAPGADLGPWMARYFDLREALEGVLGRKVDLVMASALRNPYLIRAIESDRRLLYAA